MFFADERASHRVRVRGVNADRTALPHPGNYLPAAQRHRIYHRMNTPSLNGWRGAAIAVGLGLGGRKAAAPSRGAGRSPQPVGK